MSRRGSRPSAGAPSDRVLVRAEERVDGARPFALLQELRGLPRGFWERDGRWWAWAGSAARLAVSGAAGGGRFRAVRRWAEATAGRLVGGAAGTAETAVPARFHGGFAFEPRSDVGRSPGAGRGSAAEGAWSGFPGGLFHLPAVELRGGDGSVRLAVTVEQGPHGDVASAREASRRALRRVRSRIAGPTRGGAEGDGGPAGRGRGRGGSRGRKLRCVHRRPGPGRWAEIVEAALEEIGSGRLEKVVPARLVELELAREADPVALLGRLRADNPAAIPYLVEPEPGRAFAGAAPELVAALRGERFHATAVAGTVADGADPAERERLARRLLSSAKDRREHAVGVRDMRRALRSVAGVARVDQEPRVLRLRGVQHLLTNLTAGVPAGTHVLDLLAALHPTAAVNGSPRDEALEFLRREEPFARGWYAGPVGWFDTAGDGEFAPGLRSALLRRRRVRVYSGAGIVTGSEARDEWRETGLKLRPVLEALRLERGELADVRPGAVASGGRSGV